MCALENHQLVENYPLEVPRLLQNSKSLHGDFKLREKKWSATIKLSHSSINALLVSLSLAFKSILNAKSLFAINGKIGFSKNGWNEAYVHQHRCRIQVWARFECHYMKMSGFWVFFERIFKLLLPFFFLIITKFVLISLKELNSSDVSIFTQYNSLQHEYH